MKRIVVVILMLACCIAGVEAQTKDEAQYAYEQFRQEAQQRFADFRRRANRTYADFMEQSWQDFEAGPAIPRPIEQELRPEPMPEEDWNKPIQTRPIRIEEIVTPILPKPRPMPIAPIQEVPEPQPKENKDGEQEVLPDEVPVVVPEENHEEEPVVVPVVPDAKGVDFVLYGTPLRVRFSQDCRFSMGMLTERSVTEAWRRLSTTDYDNTIYDCIRLREQLHLCDWAYLMMLEQMSLACMGAGDAATMLMAYVFCQSGYQMRLGIAGGKLVMLYASEHQLYDTYSYRIKNKSYYPFHNDSPQMHICDLAFPKEQPLSLIIAEEQNLAVEMSEPRVLSSVQNSSQTATVSVNKNLVAFYNDYPSSMIGHDMMTRWAMYANVPLQREVREQLYPQLREMVKGQGQRDAVNTLLSFVQWAFTYRYDDEIWGTDRAFFAEETLFYPYADCEDRSILFSRLVRDLFGLKVMLVYYPLHIATAVQFTEDVAGDYIKLNGQRFTICDPTYFGASVGQTMSNMDNKSAKVILLN